MHIKRWSFTPIRLPDDSIIFCVFSKLLYFLFQKGLINYGDIYIYFFNCEHEQWSDRGKASIKFPFSFSFQDAIWIIQNFSTFIFSCLIDLFFEPDKKEQKIMTFPSRKIKLSNLRLIWKFYFLSHHHLDFLISKFYFALHILGTYFADKASFPSH